MSDGSLALQAIQHVPYEARGISPSNHVVHIGNTGWTTRDASLSLGGRLVVTYIPRRPV